MNSTNLVSSLGAARRNEKSQSPVATSYSHTDAINHVCTHSLLLFQPSQWFGLNFDTHRITDDWGFSTVILLNLIFYLFSLGLSVAMAQMLANQPFLITRLYLAFGMIHQK